MIDIIGWEGIIMTSNEILSSAIEIIRRRVPAGITCQVFLFGSQATGQETERSDYDIGIEAENALPTGVILGMERTWRVCQTCTR